jgi:hypothetical protein
MSSQRAHLQLSARPRPWWRPAARSWCRRAALAAAGLALPVTVLAAGGGPALAATRLPAVPATAGTGLSTVGRVPAGLQQALDQSLDPPIQQAELTASGGASGDNFGYSVAVDGDTAVVGAPHAESSTGTAYVFTDSGGSWVQSAELSAPGASEFGWSVAISGGTIAVGAPGPAAGSGAVYVFTGSGGTWSTPTVVNAAGANFFGSSVALAGGTLVVGASDGAGASADGHVFVFTDSGGPWAQQAELDGDPTGAFGWSVATDGDTVVVGEPFAAIGSGSANGKAYVFTGAGGTWSAPTVLTASDAATGDQFGGSVAVSGGTAVIGAVGKNDHAGAAYVFTAGSGWTQQAELAASDGGANDQFGASVALSGGNLLVGAFGHNPVVGNFVGVAYLFSGAGASWPQQAELSANDAADQDHFGWSVAMSGSTLLVGADLKNNETGAAYVFGTPQSQSISFTPPATGTAGGSATLTATGGGSGNPVVFSIDPSSGAGVCSVSGTNGSTVNYQTAGSCVIDANQAGSASYSAAPQVTGTITVNQASQSISFTPSAGGTAGGSAALTATGGGSGNPVVFSVDPSSGAGVCTVSGTNGSTVNYLTAGSCVIDANQAGNASYSAASQVTGTITVNQAPAFVVASPPLTAQSGQVYDYTFTASGTPAPSYALAAGAPSWLSINASTGELTGTPPSGTTGFSYSVIATNVAGTATAGPFTVSITTTSTKADVTAGLSCPATMTLGGTATCTLSVGNNGPAAATKIIAAVGLPAALSATSCSAGCARHGNIYTWTLASLASGATAKYTITVKASRTGNVIIGAVAVAQNADPKPLNNIAAWQITVKR